MCWSVFEGLDERRNVVFAVFVYVFFEHAEDDALDAGEVEGGEGVNNHEAPVGHGEEPFGLVAGEARGTACGGDDEGGEGAFGEGGLASWGAGHYDGFGERGHVCSGVCGTEWEEVWRETLAAVAGLHGDLAFGEVGVLCDEGLLEFPDCREDAELGLGGIAAETTVDAFESCHSCDLGAHAAGLVGESLIVRALDDEACEERRCGLDALRFGVRGKTNLPPSSLDVDSGRREVAVVSSKVCFLN